MKKFSKILCAVLVIAVLCSSLIFMVGAEEGATSNLLDGYTAVSMTREDSSKLLEAVKYPADDNLLAGASISDSHGDNPDKDPVLWGEEGGRGSDLITNTATGEVIYKEYLVGSHEGKYGELTYQAAGNDFINYTFTKTEVTKEEGYNKYIVVDFDFAYEGALDGLAFQIIPRGASTYWPTTQQFRNLGVSPDTFVHVTAVYDYTTGNTHLFVNGKLYTTVTNGALNAAGVTAYAEGGTVNVSEFRVGSNSASTIYLDNLYVRSVKNAVDSDALATAATSGSLAGWDANVYGSGYDLPSIPYFAKTLSVGAFDKNSIGGSDVFVSATENNNITYIGTGNNTNSPFVTIGSAGKDPYVVVYANETTSYKGSNNNLFINANVPDTAPFTVAGEGAVGYYVIDFDIATHGNMLPGFDVSVPMRRNSDKSGYPFSDEIYVGGYVTDTDAWSHLTIVGDIANNVAKIYINGVYVGDGGKAVRNDTTDSNRLLNAATGVADTQVVAQGFRVEITRNNIQTDMSEGDNVIFDNFAHRLFVTDNYSDLAAALEDGNITDWANYDAGRSGEKLPVIAVVDGVSYRNTEDLKTAFASDDAISVDFLGQPISPVVLYADATVNTHGMDIESLIDFSNGAEIISREGNVVVIEAPYATNKVVEKVNYSNISDAEALVYGTIKGNAAGNVFSRFNMVSANASALGTPGYRYGEIVTNPLTGEVIYRESAILTETHADGSLLAGNNEYENFFFTSYTLSYEEGKNEYIVMDYDFAYEGELSGKIGFSIIPRNSGSGRWSTSISLTKFPIAEGEMVHVTAVHDYTNNKAYYFFNGELGVTVDGGAINPAGHGEYKSGTALPVSEYKLGSNADDTYYIDNMNIRIFDVATADDTIDDAVAAKDITKWTDSIYGESYDVPELPAIATVNGVEYSTPTRLAEALYGNELANVTLLHTFDEQIAVRCPAVINTNGLAHGFVACEGGSVSAEGDVLTFKAPYVGNNEIVVSGLSVNDGADATATAGHLFFDTPFYVADDNLFNRISYNDYQISAHRAAYIVQNPDNGQQYVYDTIYDTDTSKSNTFMNWYFKHDVATHGKGYEHGVDQYVVMDLDIAYDVYGETRFDFTTRNPDNANLTGNHVEIGNAMEAAGIPAGHFAHVTMLAEVDTNTVYVYVNGTKQLTISSALCKEDLGEGYYLDGVRLLQNLNTSIKYDNIYMRVVNDATLKGLDTLEGSSIEVYNDSYELPTLPKFATVDGVDYYSAAEVSAVLYGNIETPREVEFFHVTEGTVFVSCDAVLNTHGMPIKLDYHNGKLTDNGEGVYVFDCGYVSDTRVENTESQDAFYSAINVSGNNNIISSVMFNKTNSYMNTGWYDADGNYVYGIHTYLVSSKGMDNVYGMFARPEGSTGLIGGEYYEMKDGELVKAATTSGTYINLNFNTTDNAHYFTYKASENNYWVYDFDAIVEGDALEMYAYNLIKTAGGGFQYGTFDINLGVLVAENGNRGAFNHFTIVADYNNNAQYVFINDVYVTTAPLMTSTVPATAYVEGAQYYNMGLRIPVGTGNPTDNASFGIDNTLARKFVTSNSDNLAEAMEAQDITLWTGRYDYTLPETPVLGTVNGTSYNTTGELEAAIAENDGAVVELIRPIRGSIIAGGAAEINTNNFAEVVSAKYDGFYEFEDEDYGTIKASAKYVVIDNGNGLYSVETISSANYSDFAIIVDFATVPDSLETWETYAFLYGHQIEAPALSDEWTYEDYKLYGAQWFLGDELVTEFPVASKELGDISYVAKNAEIKVEVEIDASYNLTANSDFSVNLYIKAEDNIVNTGEIVKIDDVEYMLLTAKVAASELGNGVTFEYYVMYGEYQIVQYYTVSVADYAADLFAGEYDVIDKNLMYAALAYSNEAAKLFGGVENADFAQLLADNAEFAPADAELGEAVDTAALSTVIRSAALKLGSAPAFAFKVAMGYNGNITFTYTSLGETVTVTETVDATAGEQLVILSGFNAYDIHNDITIEVVVDGETVTGTYNLSTYAQKTVASDNAFATALLTYATVAEAHKLYVPSLEYTVIDKSEVKSTTLVTVVDGKIKQMDQATAGTSNGYFTKEGGTAVYVLINKDGEQVEGLYFSRSVAWAFLEEGSGVDRGTENAGFAEHRYAFDKTKVITSISFDYIINGTVGVHETLGEGVFQIKTADGTYVDAIFGNDTFVEDGEWHTITWENTDSTLIENLLIKLYAFEGELVIANLVVNYEVEEPEGLEYTVIDKSEVTSTTLVTVVDGKIKQMDQATAGTSNGYFTKEGGTSVYVLINKDGEQVEGLYFSRSVAWAFLEEGSGVDRGTENAGFAEHRYAFDKTKVITSISFDYIINGTVGVHETSGEGVFQIKTADGTYVDAIFGNDTFVEDGEWHTITWENADSTLIENLLIKLYAFEGEFVIANLVVNYEVEEPEGLQYTVIDKSEVTSDTLTAIADGKIKQCDQATLDDGSNSNKNGWFTKEGGTAVYVSAKKGGETVEALYFSREKDWTTYATADQNAGFTESRWAVNANATSISFDYIICGTVDEYAGTSMGTDLAGNTQLLSSAFVQLKTGSTVNGTATDGYPEVLNNDLIADGEWHTFTVTFDQPLDTISHFLVKLYHFNGEMLIANINVEYAA